MIRFFDASALVGAYVEEESTLDVRTLLASGAAAVSRLSEVEVVSAFARLTHEGALTVPERDKVTTAFLGELSRWVVVELTQEVAARARVLLAQHPLRAGGALQLASAVVLESRLAGPIDGFVATDQRLVEAARAERLRVLAV